MKQKTDIQEEKKTRAEPGENSDFEKDSKDWG